MTDRRICLCLLCFLLTSLRSSLCLSLAKLMDSPTSIVHSHWLRDRAFHTSRPIWLGFKLVPLASDSIKLSRKQTSVNRYSDQPVHSGPTWLHTGSDRPTVKSATLADVAYPSGSNRDAPLISTKVLSTKRNPISSTDSNHYTADNFDPFTSDIGTGFDNLFTGSLGAPKNSVIDTADQSSKQPQSHQGSNRMDDNMTEMLKIDQMDNIFDMDFDF